MNKASFSLYSPQGVRVYFETEEYLPGHAADFINAAMGVGYTVQEPVPEAGQKTFVITRYTRGEQQQDDGTTLPVVHLWSDNGNFPQLDVWPTTFLEDTQVVADIAHLLPGYDSVVPTDMTVRDKVKHKNWGHCNLKAIGVPKVDYEGNVKHTKGGNIDYRFLRIEGAGTKPQATSDSEAGDKPTTLKGALEYAKGLSIPAEAASAGMQRLVRDLFDVPQGQEREFLLSAENGKVDMVVQAYVQWADEWVEMAHHAAMDDEEIPF